MKIPTTTLIKLGVIAFLPVLLELFYFQIQVYPYLLGLLGGIPIALFIIALAVPYWLPYILKSAEEAKDTKTQK